MLRKDGGDWRDHKPVPLTDEALIIKGSVWNIRGRSEGSKLSGLRGCLGK